MEQSGNRLSEVTMTFSVTTITIIIIIIIIIIVIIIVAFNDTGEVSGSPYFSQRSSLQ